jgi:hypothetical protein
MVKFLVIILILLGLATLTILVIILVKKKKKNSIKRHARARTQTRTGTGPAPGTRTGKGASLETLNWANSLIYLAGFKWDPTQRIFETRLDAFQRVGGYNSLYDKLSTLIYMVIDVEPITFSYGGVNYMIELWKGQYFAATGCEIGIYTEVKGRPGKYKCATDAQMLHMSFNLMHSDTSGQKQEVFHRSGLHWWLTGFKPGYFSDPTDLYMENINIIFHSSAMAKAFYNALVSHFANQQEYQYTISGDTVKFRWHKTKFPQPNLARRPKFLTYDKVLAEGSKKVMKGDFSPQAINNKVLEVKAFLQQGGNFYDVVDFFLKDKDMSNIVTEWDTKHGTKDMATMYDFMKKLRKIPMPLSKGISTIWKVACMLTNNPLCTF